MDNILVTKTLTKILDFNIYSSHNIITFAMARNNKAERLCHILQRIERKR